MAVITIDRLTLKLSGLSAWEGKRLAQQIGEDLANASIAPDSLRQINTLRVNVTAKPGDKVDWLSQKIVADIIQQVNRILA